MRFLRSFAQNVVFLSHEPFIASHPLSIHFAPEATAPPCRRTQRHLRTRPPHRRVARYDGRFLARCKGSPAQWFGQTHRLLATRTRAHPTHRTARSTRAHRIRKCRMLGYAYRHRPLSKHRHRPWPRPSGRDAMGIAHAATNAHFTTARRACACARARCRCTQPHRCRLSAAQPCPQGCYSHAPLRRNAAALS